MGKLISIAVFDSIIDIRFNLLKDMLDQAGIGYVTTNENSRTVKPLMPGAPTNLTIDLKVDEDDLEEAIAIMRSIE